MNLREQILSADDLKRERVEVPEWGLTLHVRTLPGTERDEWEAAVYGEARPNMAQAEAAQLMARKRAKAQLLVRSVCDEAGQRVFADSDVEALAGKSGAAIGRLFEVAQRVNGITAQDVEALAKN